MKTRTSDPELTAAVQEGLMKAEINDYLSQEFLKEGYSSMTMKLSETPKKLTITISDTSELLGEDRSRYNQIKFLIAKRLGVDITELEMLVQKNKFPGLCPATQAEFIRSEMEGNNPHRRAVQRAIRNIKKDGAQGVMICVRGKLKGQRAREVKTIDGRVLFAGEVAKKYMRTAQSTLYTKTGIIGIKVYICLPYDEEGIKGPNVRPVDKITLL